MVCVFLSASFHLAHAFQAYLCCSNSSIPFFFMARYSIECIFYILLIYSTINGILVTSTLWLFMKKAMNMGVQICV